MEINDYSYYNTDNKCYQPKREFSDENKLKEYIDNNFHSEKFNIEKTIDKSILSKCKNKAIDNNKDFFLVSDASIEKNTNQFTYNCLIPKKDKACDFVNLDNFLKPFNTIINDLFGHKTEGGIAFRSNTTITPDNEVKLEDLTKELTSNNIHNSNNCFFIKDDNNQNVNLAKSGNYVMYKTEFIDNSEYTDNLTTVKKYTYYKDRVNEIFEYEGKLDMFKHTFQEYICNPNKHTEDKLNKEIHNLKNIYDTIFDEFDNLSQDMSSVSLLTKYDTLYLEKLQKDIDQSKQKLKNLIGFDGANNGKFNDTTYLKNLKISEISTLFIVIAFTLFYYAKNKK